MLPCAGSRSIHDRLEPDQNDLTSRERFLFQFVAHKDILVCLPGSINPCHPNYSHPSTICQNIVVVTLEATWQDALGSLRVRQNQQTLGPHTICILWPSSPSLVYILQPACIIGAVLLLLPAPDTSDHHGRTRGVFASVYQLHSCLFRIEGRDQFIH